MWRRGFRFIIGEYLEVAMTLLEQIEKQLSALPAEKQNEVLDFIVFLQQRADASQPVKQRSLKQHDAFGSWKNRKIDAVKYQQNLRGKYKGKGLMKSLIADKKREKEL
jgi:hypothetical protein